MLKLTGKRVWVTGHAGLVGSAVVRHLAVEGCEVLTADRLITDLRQGITVDSWVDVHKPDIVIHTAAMVNGIVENINQPADFLHDNLLIDANVIHACRGVEEFVYLGSACAYPPSASTPFKESAFLTGPPEVTNRAYAIAKIAGMELVEAYRHQYSLNAYTVSPCNVYGPGDRSTHVIPMLIDRMHAAKAGEGQPVKVWGTGTPVREFIYVDDLAKAIIHLLNTKHVSSIFNVGSGESTTIAQLARHIAAAVGYDGDLVFTQAGPDGIDVKTIDSHTIRILGWRAQMSLVSGLAITYKARHP